MTSTIRSFMWGPDEGEPATQTSEWSVIWGPDEGESKAIISATQTSGYLVVSGATKFLNQITATEHFMGLPEFISRDFFGHPRYMPIHITAGNTGVTSMLVVHKRAKNFEQATSELLALPLRPTFPPRQRSGNVKLKSTDLAQATMWSVHVTRHDTGHSFDFTEDLISFVPGEIELVLKSGLRIPGTPGLAQAYKYGKAGLERFVGMQHKDIFAQMRKGGAGYGRTYKGLKLGDDEFNIPRNIPRLESAVSVANEAYLTLPAMDDYITFWLCKKMRAWKKLP